MFSWLTYWIQQDISCAMSYLRFVTGFSDELPVCVER